MVHEKFVMVVEASGVSHASDDMPGGLGGKYLPGDAISYNRLCSKAKIAGMRRHSGSISKAGDGSRVCKQCAKLLFMAGLL